MNPFKRTVLGAAFHVPTVVKRQQPPMDGLDIMLRLALAAEIHGTSAAVKATVLRLQDRISPADRPIIGLFLEAKDAVTMVWLALDEMDLPEPAVTHKHQRLE